jgi:hypothetical protein
MYQCSVLHAVAGVLPNLRPSRQMPFNSWSFVLESPHTNTSPASSNSPGPSRPSLDTFHRLALDISQRNLPFLQKCLAQIIDVMNVPKAVIFFLDDSTRGEKNRELHRYKASQPREIPSRYALSLSLAGNSAAVFFWASSR